MSVFLITEDRVLEFNIQADKNKYSYQFSTSVLKSQKILLPTTKSWELDQEFMENYMKEVEKKSSQKTIKYFESRLYV
ncbi:MAG: hypothetical protein LBI53_00685 [Candidatus Peribacteria bacterium]|jgi:hypothetical protein|nr:hypothetical protein [Candidatus Peribacteria bacterium]